MTTASLGRRLGDWLGIVPEDEIPRSAPPEVIDVVEVRAVRRESAPVVPEVQAAPPAPAPSSAPTFTPYRLGAPIPEPKKAVTFRSVVNERRAENQRRAVNPQAPSHW